MFDGDMMSIAFNVNDNLSLSWSEMTATYDPQNHSATGVDEVGVDEKHESLQLAYSMGGMSVKDTQLKLLTLISMKMLRLTLRMKSL